MFWNSLLQKWTIKTPGDFKMGLDAAHLHRENTTRLGEKVAPFNPNVLDIRDINGANYSAKKQAPKVFIHV